MFKTTAEVNYIKMRSHWYFFSSQGSAKQEYSDNLILVLSLNVFALFLYRIIAKWFSTYGQLQHISYVRKQYPVPPSYKKYWRIPRSRPSQSEDWTSIQIKVPAFRRLHRGKYLPDHVKLLTRCFGSLGWSAGVSKTRLQFWLL